MSSKAKERALAPEAAPPEAYNHVTKESKDAPSHGLFHAMAKAPWPFLLFWPVVFCALIGLGFSQDDIIEDEIAKTWVPTRSDYAQDEKYSSQFGKGTVTVSSFAAMAIARDGGNLFTENRLEAIRARMEATEKTTVRIIVDVMLDTSC